MKYFLDTNIISYYLKGKYPSIQDHFISVPSRDIFIPSVVVAEIEYGLQKCNDYEGTKRLYSKFLESFKVIPFNDNSAYYYGVIRATLEKKGQLIGSNDMLIAATVLSEDGILITNNTSEFSRISNLRLENWIEQIGLKSCSD